MSERFTLTIEAASGTYLQPPVVRLRALLKLMLRAFGLRVVTCTTDSGSNIHQS